jgi:small subunit ribosomal protein S20
MPNSTSAKKRLRQSLEQRARNRSGRSVLRSQLRKARELVAAGDVAGAEAQVRVVAQKFDKAASKGLIHANAAARTKSRLASSVKALKAKGDAS